MAAPFPCTVTVRHRGLFLSRALLVVALAALAPLTYLAVRPAPEPAPAFAAAAVYQAARPAVVVVTVPGSTGAGFVIDPAGDVLTARHVVAGRRQARVWLADCTEHTADVVAEDAGRDLALLRLRVGRALPALRLAGRDPEVGEPVLLVGHPYGLLYSVTAGVVSGVGREAAREGGPARGLVQTDAPSNQGNSGGPVLDRHGEVLGVVRMKRPEGVTLAACAAEVRVFLAEAAAPKAEPVGPCCGGCCGCCPCEPCECCP